MVVVTETTMATKSSNYDTLERERERSKNKRKRRKIRKSMKKRSY